MKTKHLIIFLLLAALAPWTAEAQTKTHIANTASSTQMTWDEFAQNVNNGITYEGETVYLDADITATTMAGTNENNCFKGTFEGQGHTLTFNYTASGSYYTAPFHYLNGATIQNLKVSGTITANYARCGGLAGNCYGTNAIINCLSDITINSTVNGDGTHGGFISRVFRGSTTFEGCTFAGSLIGENTIANGGFVGWSEGNNNYASVSFSNCIYAPVANTTDPSAGATFARGRNNSTTGITISNCFYTSSEFQYTQGKQMHYVSGVNSVVLSMAGEPTHYSVSGITAYSGNQGLNYYGVRAGVGDVVLLNLLGGNTYTISFGGGTLTGDSNPYTLIMPDNDVGIIAESFFPLPFVNDFESGCDMFLYNGGKPDCWCWGTAASHGGTHGLYISNDGGATNNYNNMVEESVYAVKPLHFERGGYDISYDWRSNGGYLRVALAPDWLKFDGVFNINWTNEWVALDGGSSLNNSTEWQTVHQTIEFDAPVDRQLVFIWNNYGVQDINNPPAAIDNVSVMSVSCNKPYDLQCTGFTGTTATLSWTENGDATAWQICLNGDESNLVEANSNPFTLTNLTPEIQYTAKVRANCGNEQSSWSNTISFSPSFKVVIGSGMNPSGSLPTDNELDYDLTQQIYTTGELGDAGVFMSIDFFRVSGQFPQASCARNLDIYMTHTDKNVYESNSDWVNVTNADLVFSGTVDFAKDVWTTITLDTPFEYDGQHNVIITVDDNTGSHDDYALFMTFVPYQLQSLGIDSWEITNNFNYDPATYSGSGSLYYDKNHIRVMKLPYGPENLQYSDVTFTTAELSWSGNSESYVVMVSNDNASWDESRTTTSTSYTLTGLYPGTTYQVKVKGVTGGQETAPSHPVYFTTLGDCPTPTNLTVGYVSSTTAELSWSASRYMNSYTVKYKIRGNVFSEGFENGIDDWTIVDGVETFTSASNYAAHTGSYGFRFDSNSSHPQYLVSPELTGITEGMMLEFYYKNWVQGMSETFQMGFSSTDNAIESFTFGDEITVDDAQWHLFSETIPAGTKYICWKYSTAGNWSLFLDDIAVGLDNPWQTITTEGSTTQVSATLTGLMPATTYEAYVYPDCNPDNVTETVYFKTTEDCPRPENLTASYVGATTADLSWTGVPEEESYTMEYREASTVFSEGFENGIGNWTLRNCSGSTGIMTYQGGSAVFLFNNFHNIQYLISPELSGVSDGMKLEFEYYIPVNSTLQETFQIGLSSTDNATESFTFGDTITVTAGQHFTYTELIPAGTKYICWKYITNHQGLYIDNIVVGLDTPAGAWQTVTVEGNTAEVSATLTDLSPETSYEVHVYPDCDPDKVSATLFFLTQEVCIAPHNLTADKVTATTVKLSWTGEPDLDSYTVEYRTKGDILSEGFENGIGDWTLRNCANNTGIYSSAHSGNNGFVFRNTSNPPQYLITPELEGVTAGKKLEYYYKNANPRYPETFQLGFSSTNNATASFTFGNEITVTDGQWHVYSETIPAGTKYICWKCTSNNQFGFIIDDIAVGMLDWQTVTVAGNSLQVSTTLTGLTPETPYEAYVYPNCNPEFVSETVYFTTTEVPVTVTQTLTLSEGWNWVSLYVEGDPIDLLQTLESALAENATQISSAELFTENDEGDWWGDLDEEGLTNEQMYMILVETPCTIEVEGVTANSANHAITINPGWNWIGFPCDHEMTIEEALGGFDAEDGDVFANSENFTEFDGEWFGDVETLLPGQGFMYFSNSNEPKTLIIGSSKGIILKR